MKKLTLFFLVAALCLGLGLAVVYAETSGNDAQDITGNITAGLTISAPAAYDTWESSKMTVGAGGNETANQGITVCSNTTYGIKVRPDSTDSSGASNKDGYMHRDSTAVLFTLCLQNALQWKESASGEYAVLDYNNANGGEVGTGLAATDDDGDITNVKFKQVIGYGDTQLSGTDKWKLVVTYLADQSW